MRFHWSTQTLPVMDRISAGERGAAGRSVLGPAMRTSRSLLGLLAMPVLLLLATGIGLIAALLLGGKEAGPFVWILAAVPGPFGFAAGSVIWLQVVFREAGRLLEDRLNEA